jgi:2-(1,2-epoxy-1,2-dihydrophenyl)acetyl-CoA isomerase
MPLPPLQTTRYAVEHGIATITLDRPDKLNAYNAQMRLELELLFDETDADDAVRAVIVTGAGRAFCAGGDVKGFAARGGEGGGATASREERVARQRLSQHATTGRLHEFGKPTVAALPGAAAGAGIGLALACDLRVGCSASAIVGAFGKVGLSGDYGATWLLTSLVGPARARRMLFLGERVDAATALE